MYAPFTVITNNPLIIESGWPSIQVTGSIEEVLQKVLEMTLVGYRLLSHPLSGSVKPAVNPYKSILISPAPAGVDYREVEIVLTCLDKVKDMRRQAQSVHWGEVVDADLRFLDCELIKSGIQSLVNVS
ncbi:MAG: GrdX family protein [Methylocystaceae bacterium]